MSCRKINDTTIGLCTYHALTTIDCSGCRDLQSSYVDGEICQSCQQAVAQCVANNKGGPESA